MGGAGTAAAHREGPLLKRVGFFPYSWQQYFTDKSGSSTASQRELDNLHRLEQLRARLRVEPKARGLLTRGAPPKHRRPAARQQRTWDPLRERKPILKRTPPRSARIAAAAVVVATHDSDWSHSRALAAGVTAPAPSSSPSVVGPQLVDVSLMRSAPLSADFEEPPATTSRRRFSPPAASSDIVVGGGIGRDTQLIGSCPSPLPHYPSGNQARRNDRASVDAASCAVFLATRMASTTEPPQQPPGLPAGASRAGAAVQDSSLEGDAATSSADGGWCFMPDPNRARMYARTALLEEEPNLRYVEPAHEGGGGGGGGGGAKASAWKRFVALAARALSGGSAGGSGRVAAADAGSNGAEDGEAEEPLPVMRSMDSAKVHRKRMGLDGRPKRLVRAGPVGTSNGQRTTHPGEESEAEGMDAEVVAAAEAFMAAASAASATGRGFVTGAGGAAAAGAIAGRTCSSSSDGGSSDEGEDSEFTPIGTTHGATSAKDEDDERAAWAAAAIASAPLPMSAHVYRMDSSKSACAAPSSVPGRGRSFRVRSAASARL